MINTVCHFEIPADNVEALQKFYEKLFGWKFEKMPGPMDYRMIQTGSQEVEGGLMARVHPQQTIVNYVRVEAVEASTQTAVDMGAEVVMPRTPVPGYGWFAVLIDPQKNPIGLWQDDTSAA
jgi:hypothetical protein